MSSDGPVVSQSGRYGIFVLVDDQGRNGVLRQEGEAWRIEFEGTVTVTDRDGSTHRECATQAWSFSSDSGFLVTINFGTERTPRVSLAGNDKTPMGVVAETIASTIRATSSQSETHPTPEAT